MIKPPMIKLASAQKVTNISRSTVPSLFKSLSPSLFPSLAGISLIAVFCLSAGWSSIAQAQEKFDVESLKIRDSLTLRTGATLKGSLISSGTDDSGRKFIVFKTLDGSVLKLDKAKLIKGAPKVVDATGLAYNKRISQLDDTVESHRAMVEWCSDQPRGSSLFKDQIVFHRERIMAMDPNDSLVKKKLGYSQIEEPNGTKRWVPTKHFHESIGYLKDKTSWISRVQHRANETDKNIRSSIGVKRGEFRTWEKKLRKKDAANYKIQLQNELQKICDPIGVRVVFEEWQDESEAWLRRWYIDAIGNVQTPTAVNALVDMAVMDPSEDNRDRALVMLAQPHYSQDQAAIRMASMYLKSSNNSVIKRAGTALGRLGSEKVILQLADALITTHVKSKGDPGRMNFSFGNGQLGGMTMGGDQPKIGKVQNDTVLNALEAITKQQNLGYDSSRWRDWYVRTHTHYDLDLRGER
ncbi:MAG: HEAT repeat domain-containing protein [Mariniblastus sp.]